MIISFQESLNIFFLLNYGHRNEGELKKEKNKMSLLKVTLNPLSHISANGPHLVCSQKA